MSDLLNISDFTNTKGLPLGKNNESFTYLYGLSDFWQYLFQDTSVTNLLLETTSVQASDIYSTFLQLCTGLSISDIEKSASSQLRLEIISTSLNLPKDVPIISATWLNGFSTIKVDNPEGFKVGDTISITNAVSTTYYYLGYGVNEQPIDVGGSSYTAGGVSWNGTFTITSISVDGLITYYQPSNTQSYVSGGTVSTVNIGIETYQLPEGVNTTRFIANRAFLPTIVLEENVDYYIDTSTYRISFAQPLNSYGFPSRVGVSGAVEYPLWFVDITYDEDLIYSQYPLLLDLTAPSVSNESYRNFLYGLFYMYTGGPTLSVVEKGINLCLGAPLAREIETVLDVRSYLGADQFLIITDLNSYLLPSGVIPAVNVGQTLAVGDELAKWIEIKDYVSSGTWWRDHPVDLPVELMPIVPTGFSRAVGGLTVSSGLSTSDGTGNIVNDNAINDEEVSAPYDSTDYADWVMVNYLKHNTFLVKVNVTYSKYTSAQKFEDMSKVLMDLRPKGTFPIYSYVTDVVGSFAALSGVSSPLLQGTIT